MEFFLVNRCQSFKCFKSLMTNFYNMPILLKLDYGRNTIGFSTVLSWA